MSYSPNPDKITRDYFDSLLLETRYLDAQANPCTRISLFGHEFDTPVMTAALSHLHNTVPDGMTIYAEGAAKADTLHWVGMDSGQPQELEKILKTGAKTIKIIKPHADNKVVFSKIEQAVSLGCIAVGMDIDHAFKSDGTPDSVFGLNMAPKTSEEISEFVQAAGVPFIVKGVLSPRDAEKCAKAGCAGIVISHHHGMMQYSLPPLMALPEIRKAVGNDMDIFVDCGIETGIDAYKCLALGAKAVSVGRHLMPLLKDGSDAVAARIIGLTGELKGVMARTGVKDLCSFDPTVIHKRTF